ncbi:hypothetical protein CRE_26875 [Caenorhabditis remanei]|uniref:Uncharacterized protein n=1 Tax=Caenorhabditis remanei TaxID=31234 RepID=E3NQ92_CAERE|nr:hypothetical protein CRE_26875 [Caenorhabditis remanei]
MWLSKNWLKHRSKTTTEVQFPSPSVQRVLEAMASDPPPPQLTERWANVALENKSGHIFKLEVMHQYTGHEVQSSGWHILKPNEKLTVLKVNFNTGVFTTGTDNWKVHGLKKKEKDSQDFTESWRSGTGAAGTDWKKHTLRTEDDGEVTEIKVFESEIQFVSKSGTSTTSFYRHDE